MSGHGVTETERKAIDFLACMALLPIACRGVDEQQAALIAVGYLDRIGLPCPAARVALTLRVQDKAAHERAEDGGVL